MTIVFQTYRDDDGNAANIEQDKFSACFRLDIRGKYIRERRDYYRTIKSARAYLLKHYPTMKKVYDRRNKK